MLAVGSDHILRVWKNPCEAFFESSTQTNQAPPSLKAATPNTASASKAATAATSAASTTTSKATLSNAAPCMELRGHNEPITCVAWHPTQPFLLVTASSDKSVRFWDFKSKPNYNLLLFFSIEIYRYFSSLF